MESGKAEVNSEQFESLVVMADRLTVVSSLVRGHIHDARNPLHAVSMAMQAMSEANDPALTQSLLGMVSGEATRITAILDSLASVVKHQDRDDTPLSLSGVFDSVRNLAEKQRPPSTANVDYPETHMLPAVKADHEDLEHVFLGLISNAKLAIGDKSSGNITVSCKESGDFVETVVRDNGGGLDLPLDQAIKPFASGWNREGLGLPAVRIIVTRFGGSFTLDTTDDGVSASVSIPVWK